MKRAQQQRGAVTIEMTLVGIPVIFILIITFEISRGMWMYDTLAAAAKEGVRYSIVHGYDCSMGAPVNNTCGKTIGDVAAVIKNAGVGLDPNTTNVTFIAAGSTIASCKLADCIGSSTPWLQTSSYGAGTRIEIDMDTPFRSALAGFWPGTTPQSFALTKFAANSADTIQF